jgi:hypothetical protein
MKFRGIKQIISETNAWREISEALRDLFQGLTKLSFVDNMDCFEIKNLTITAGTTVKIVNKLAFIPTKWILTSNSSGQAIGDDGFSTWNGKEVSLKNYGTATTVISVIFFR